MDTSCLLGSIVKHLKASPCNLGTMSRLLLLALTAAAAACIDASGGNDLPDSDRLLFTQVVSLTFAEIV